jgi:rifampicin phosphotransferase
MPAITPIYQGFITRFESGDATLETVGGKAVSLARMAAAGLPVPSGFHVTTAAYRQFVEANGIQGAVVEAATGASPDDPAALDRASATIRALFERGMMPVEVAAAIREAYGALGGDETAVVVRSSGTAEDLLEASFAGQHETYLNVRGEVALLQAVQRCWASLWTARAIGYRARAGVAHERVALAVVVQHLVEADAAGVLFTANPSTGDRAQLVINASFGLGESIVGGEVTPDTYVLDRATLRVLEARTGDKQREVLAASGSGTEHREVSHERRSKPALAEPARHELAQLALQAEALFDGMPLDIEWAVAGGKIWLLQARPITGLPPAPLKDVTWEPPTPGSAWIRRQVVENMPEPLSPLFEELYLKEGLERSVDTLLDRMGMSPTLYEDIVERPLFATVNGYAYMRGNYNFRVRDLREWLGDYLSGASRFFREGISFWRDESLPSYQRTIEQWKKVDPVAATDEDLLLGVRRLAWADAEYWFAAAVALATSKVSEGVLHWYLSMALPERGLTSGRFLRGFPSKTLVGQAALEALAAHVRRSESLRTLVENTLATRLREALAASEEGRELLAALDRYLEDFGHQIYNLDFAEPTQADDPLPLLLSLKALSRGPAADIEARRTEMGRERDRDVARTARTLDPVRRFVFHKVVALAQHFGPYREQALFYSGAAWPVLRKLAHELGSRLTKAGALHRADDVFYLRSGEIEDACDARSTGERRDDLAQRARDRRTLRDARKRLHPPAAVPADYRLRLGPFDLTLFETQRRNVDRGPVLTGFAVSPGRVTAPASVIRSPASFEQMVPGTVLVCPTTTPAWTPLFGQARGLVTDVGGILAHGSIVAREYGIPAVMGTGNGTQRIVNGQTITVDGDAGTVTLLDQLGGTSAAPPDERVRSVARRRWTASWWVRAGLIAGILGGVALWKRQTRS